MAKSLCMLACLGILVAGCGAGPSAQRGFYPTIDCRGPFVAPDFRARCGPYRNAGRNN